MLPSPCCFNFPQLILVPFPQILDNPHTHKVCTLRQSSTLPAGAGRSCQHNDVGIQTIGKEGIDKSRRSFATLDGCDGLDGLELPHWRCSLQWTELTVSFPYYLPSVPHLEQWYCIIKIIKSFHFAYFVPVFRPIRLRKVCLWCPPVVDTPLYKFWYSGCKSKKELLRHCQESERENIQFPFPLILLAFAWQ